MTHKVVNLVDYLGFGSFNVSLASCIPTLVRWYRAGPPWALQDPDDTDGLVDEIAATAVRKIRSLRRDSSTTQERWGSAFMRRAARQWRRTTPTGEREALLENPSFGEVLQANLTA
jgi:hypothetical protein